MRAMRLLPLLLLAVPLVACDKPSEADCKKAAANMQKVEGIDAPDLALQTNRFVRQCRSQFSKKAVQCVINSKTSEEIDKCFPARKDPPPPAPAPAPAPAPGTAPAPAPAPGTAPTPAPAPAPAPGGTTP